MYYLAKWERQDFKIITSRVVLEQGDCGKSINKIHRTILRITLAIYI